MCVTTNKVYWLGLAIMFAMGGVSCVSSEIDSELQSSHHTRSAGGCSGTYHWTTGDNGKLSFDPGDPLAEREAWGGGQYAARAIPLAVGSQVGVHAEMIVEPVSDEPLTLTSSNPEVMSVENLPGPYGLITVKKPGTAQIRGSLGGVDDHRVFNAIVPEHWGARIAQIRPDNQENFDFFHQSCRNIDPVYLPGVEVLLTTFASGNGDRLLGRRPGVSVLAQNSIQQGILNEEMLPVGPNGNFVDTLKYPESIEGNELVTVSYRSVGTDIEDDELLEIKLAREADELELWVESGIGDFSCDGQKVSSQQECLYTVTDESGSRFLDGRAVVFIEPIWKAHGACIIGKTSDSEYTVDVQSDRGAVEVLGGRTNILEEGCTGFPCNIPEDQTALLLMEPGATIDIDVRGKGVSESFRITPR